MSKKNKVEEVTVEAIEGEVLMPVRSTFDSVKAEQLEETRKGLLLTLVRTDNNMVIQSERIEEQISLLTDRLAKLKADREYVKSVAKEVEEAEDFSAELKNKVNRAYQGKPSESKDVATVVTPSVVIFGDRFTDQELMAEFNRARSRLDRYPYDTYGKVVYPR